MMKKVLSIFLCLCFGLNEPLLAQLVPHAGMPAPPAERFRPLHLRYVAPEGDRFRLMFDKGDMPAGDPSLLEAQEKTAYTYFLTGISLPADCFWVNLRPD
jgi:hypothetical protein